MEKYVHSDFVARVRIVKNYSNQGASLTYKSTVAIKQLFKGKMVKSILIEGSSDGKRRTSCDIYFKEGTEMLVYARLDGSGKYIFNSCSGYRVITHSDRSAEKRELEMLDFLDRNNIRTTDKTQYGANLDDNLKNLRGIDATKSFAIYEVTFASDLRVDTVKTISGFTADLDEKLSLILRQAHWVSDGIFIDGMKKQVPAGSKLLFGFYYYAGQASFPSLISEWEN
jgi:hypothetical protein